MKKKTLWISALILIIISFFVYLNINEEANSTDLESFGGKVGDMAPDFFITDTEGNIFKLNDFNGKKVIIGFFATWCTPCQIEAENLKRVDDELGGNKFIVYQIGVDNKESLQDLKNFKTNFGNDNWIVGFGPDVANKYSVDSLDTTIIVDENGKIIYRDNGIPASIETLRRFLK